jgi:hypothetical protein
MSFEFSSMKLLIPWMIKATEFAIKGLKRSTYLFQRNQQTRYMVHKRNQISVELVLNK